MLVLTRKSGESIMIGDQIELTILSIEGDTVKVGIAAPKQVQIYRKEVFETIQESNREASRLQLDTAKLKDIFRNQGKQ